MMTGTPLRAAHRYSTSLTVDILLPAARVSGDAINISTGGMFVRTDRPLRKGAVVSCALAFPDGEPPASARARVVYVAGRGGGLGMQFLDDRRSFHERIDRHIESILHQGQKPALPLLSAARQLLQEKGWTQLDAKNIEGRFCLSGALLQVAGEDERAYQAALESIGSRLRTEPCAYGGFGCHCAVVRWNDVEGRTQQQVIAKIDEVIDAELRSTPAG
jgi:hypothetical protein